jgi:hypothetical protein
MSNPAFEAALRLELEKRIVEISAYTDQDFGRIGAGEWFCFCLIGVVLPILVVWLAA